MARVYTFLKLVPIVLVVFYLYITSAFVMSFRSEIVFLGIIMVLSLAAAFFLFVMKQIAKEKMLAFLLFAVVSMGYSIWMYCSQV